VPLPTVVLAFDVTLCLVFSTHCNDAAALSKTHLFLLCVYVIDQRQAVDVFHTILSNTLLVTRIAYDDVYDSRSLCVVFRN